MLQKSQTVLSQLMQHNSSLKERLKILEEENQNLSNQVKLLDIHRSNNVSMISTLNRHKDEQKALSLHIIDPTKFEPPTIGKKRKLEEGEGSKVSKNEEEQSKE